ncbi:YitT family protein [Enterococcus timonensis]|uniref:YitT family protein n=1 Tax=Enterococcus timonensis TaxID=1852364 RepID=UPI0008D9AD31|nr:YitT family protein [Enterococcus timonensis]
MQALKKELHSKDALTKAIVILFTGLTGAIGLNMFLVPAQIFSSGANGIAQILSTSLAPTIHLDTGLLILLLNIPIAILGFYKLGAASTLLSFINVIGISIFTMIMPVVVVTENPLMNAIVGGFLVGLGAGYSLKYGFTTGGMDIVSLVLSKTTGKTVGNLMMALNGAIVLIAGFLFSWESALYTLISIFVMGLAVDNIHTSHQKLTAMIVTNHPDEISSAIAKQMLRGMTLLPSYGGYRRTESRMIMMVITKYELYDLETIVAEIDPDAFMNVLPTQTVIGRFANEDEQKKYKSTGNFPELKPQKYKK